MPAAPPPGFRDFFPEDCARRNHIVATWRETARTFGFREFDGPTLEFAELYKKKNEEGAEILDQLYAFEDRGGRELALRPEMTPTLARMVAARECHYRKPLKWFCVPNFFRHERQQKGRLREFLQFNADILGEPSHEADAELIALAVSIVRAFGPDHRHFHVRIGDRRAWTAFLDACQCPPALAPGVLACVDKIGRLPDDVLATRLAPSGVSLDAIRAFMSGPVPDSLGPLIDALDARGLAAYATPDLSIVRGLNYYSGVVFELFDRPGHLRALAGGGRYDGLVAGLSDGAADLPAAGFGMGDVVLSHLIESVPGAAARLEAAASHAIDAYIVIADESLRPGAAALAQSLRALALAVEFPLRPARVPKQFQEAESLRAAHAIVVGSEWPAVKVKSLASREETTLPAAGLPAFLRRNGAREFLLPCGESGG